MLTSPAKTERIHALDSLRAIMMLLGVVIHSALTYGEIDYTPSWSLHDPVNNHQFFDYIGSYVHAFRMPIFFVIAGFFGALLFYERSPKKMLGNRFFRIFLPFVAFAFLLWPSIVFSFTYTKAVFAGAEDAISLALSSISNFRVFFPGSTFHLWFLYYLMMISVFSWILGLLFNKFTLVSAKIKDFSDWLMNKPWLRLMIFSTLTFIILVLMDRKWVSTSTSWLPDFKTFSFYLFFYLMGWILFKSKQQLSELMRFDWIFTIMGTALFSLKFFWGGDLAPILIMAVNSLAVWMLIFGYTGLFLRYASDHSNRMRYNSDSAYWVYLLHLSFTAFIPGLIAHWNISPFLKFSIVLVSTSLICIISYHYLVRSTFIGKFLNGRKYINKSILEVIKGK